MVNTNFATGGLIGVDTGNTHTDAKFAVGTRVEGKNGAVFEYVQAAAAITQYDTVHITSAYQAAAITAALAPVAGQIGFAQVAFASAEYGWVMLAGKPVLRLAASCKDDVNLYTTDTAGVLDDATATLSHFLIRGLAADGSASSGVTAVTCVASWPIVRRASDTA